MTSLEWLGGAGCSGTRAIGKRHGTPGLGALGFGDSARRPQLNIDRLYAVTHMGACACTGVEPVTLQVRLFLGLETEEPAVPHDRVGCGPEDAFGTAMGQDHKESISLHWRPPSLAMHRTKRSGAAIGSTGVQQA
jgi:hypothetical protein